VFEITKPFLHFGLRFYAGSRQVLPYFYSIAAGWNDYFRSYEKDILMKKTNIFYQLLIGVALCGCMYCGNGGQNNSGQPYDSTKNNSDSMSAAHDRDPATAYPQPPVTGSNQDSSRTKDSSKVKDTQNRPGY
jgi:hypothetical protein